MTNENIEQTEAEQSGVRGGDTATRHFSGDELANGAADALHGSTANVENRKQGGATELIGGTLIGDELPNDENEIGKRVERDADRDDA
jgi:hypothetical protein